MVYYYFPTKDDLFFAVVEDVYAKVLKDMAAALGVEGSLEQRIRALYTRLGTLNAAERRVLRLVAHEALAGSTRFLGLVERFKRGHVALVFQLVAEGLGAGSFRTDVHPFVIVASIIALGTMPQVVFQVAGDHLPMIPKFSQEVFVSQLTEALFHGVNAPRAQLVPTPPKSD